MDETHCAQLLLCALKDQMVGRGVEAEHAADPNDIFAHRVLKTEAATETLQDHDDSLNFNL